MLTWSEPSIITVDSKYFDYWKIISIGEAGLKNYDQISLSVIVPYVLIALVLKKSLGKIQLAYNIFNPYLDKEDLN